MWLDWKPVEQKFVVRLYGNRFPIHPPGCTLSLDDLANMKTTSHIASLRLAVKNIKFHFWYKEDLHDLLLQVMRLRQLAKCRGHGPR
jgi:hypothetical protein